MKKLILAALVTLAGLGSIAPTKTQYYYQPGLISGIVGGTIGTVNNALFGGWGYSPYYYDPAPVVTYYYY